MPSFDVSKIDSYIAQIQKLEKDARQQAVEAKRVGDKDWATEITEHAESLLEKWKTLEKSRARLRGPNAGSGKYNALFDEVKSIVLGLGIVTSNIKQVSIASLEVNAGAYTGTSGFYACLNPSEVSISEVAGLQSLIRPERYSTSNKDYGLHVTLAYDEDFNMEPDVLEALKADLSTLLARGPLRLRPKAVTYFSQVPKDLVILLEPDERLMKIFDTIHKYGPKYGYPQYEPHMTLAYDLAFSDTEERAKYGDLVASIANEIMLDEIVLNSLDIRDII